MRRPFRAWIAALVAILAGVSAGLVHRYPFVEGWRQLQAILGVTGGIAAVWAFVGLGRQRGRARLAAAALLAAAACWLWFMLGPPR